MHGGMPLRKSNRTQRTETASEDTARERRHCGQDRQTRLTQRKGGRCAQDRARECQQGPPQKRTRTPPRRSEGWNERLRQGRKLRNKREIGGGPLKGKNQGEREELSQTRGRSEGHSQHADSHRAPRESTGRGRSPTIRRYHPARKTTYGQEEVQGRWSRKCTCGQGRTKERSNNPRIPAASARTTRKGSAGSCRALREASERGRNLIRKDVGEGTKDNLRPGASAMKADM